MTPKPNRRKNKLRWLATPRDRQHFMVGYFIGLAVSVIASIVALIISVSGVV